MRRSLGRNRSRRIPKPHVVLKSVAVAVNHAVTRPTNWTRICEVALFVCPREVLHALSQSLSLLRGNLHPVFSSFIALDLVVPGIVSDLLVLAAPGITQDAPPLKLRLPRLLVDLDLPILDDRD